MPRPNPPETEAKGLHKTGQTQFGVAGHREALQGTSLASAAARMGQRRAKPAKAWPRARGMSSNLPLPQQEPWVLVLLGQRSSFASANLFFLPSTLWMHWVHAGGLGNLSSHRCSYEGAKAINHSHRNARHSPGSSLLLLHSLQRRFSPLLPPDSLGTSLVYKLRGSGQRLIMYS